MSEPSAATYKRCSHCKKYKLKTLFSMCATAKDGLHHRCKECQSHMYEEFKLRHGSKVAEDRRQWYLNNIDKVREYYKKWRRSNINRVRGYSSKFYKTEHGKNVRRITNQKRRDMCSVVLTEQEWNDILMKQNNHCAGCATKFSTLVRPELDHIIPVSKGGVTSKDNTQALCRYCNSSKGNRLNWTYPYVREWT